MQIYLKMIFQDQQWRLNALDVIVFLLNVEPVKLLTIAQIATGKNATVGQKIMV